MQCTLLIPHLLWPRAAAGFTTAALELPALSKLLARASAERYSPVTPEAWLCQAFEVERQRDWPIAPLTLTLDGGDAGHAYWLRADPVHIRVGREGAQLVDTSLFTVDEADAKALVASLNHHFAGELVFLPLQPKRWYVQRSPAPALKTHPPGEVVGSDMRRFLPSGDDALAWHRTFNEIQMLLFSHPVNEAREARGEWPINSVWFWGGGIAPSVAGRHFAAVWGDDAVATALAAASDTHTEALPKGAGAWLERARSDSAGKPHLIVLDALRSAAAIEDPDSWRDALASLESHWFAPLLAALRRGALSELNIVALSESASRRFTVRRADLVKIWRRPQALTSYA